MKGKVVPLHAMKATGEWRQLQLLTSALGSVTSQIHGPAALPPIPTEYKNGLALKPGSSLRRKDKSVATLYT